LRNLMLDFFYLKYHKIRLGPLDGLSLVYSFNSQREERVNQGGNGNPRAAVNHEYERMRVHGVQAHADKLIGARQTLLFGGEYYQERLKSPSFAFDPVNGVSSPRRPRVPDNARYRSGGLFVQDVFDVAPGRLRLIGNLRYGAASYRVSAEDSPLVNGRRLWPDESLNVSDVTFRAGLVLTAAPGLNFMANFSEGFRAPQLTDLDTLGLTGSGFEVPASEITGLGATIGSTADRNAVSTGRPVVRVKSETSHNYEVGLRFYKSRIDTDFAFFVNDVNSSIAKQALILPAGSVGRTLGDQVVTAQAPGGAVFVTAATNPVLVRANFGDARIFGFEHTFELRLSPAWSTESVFTYLRAQDRKSRLPPNIEGGTPAPEAYLKIRYSPSRRRLWLEPYIHAAHRQDRLSSLDLEDRRTGAVRSRASIRNFFFGGALARGLVGFGADGVGGTSDDILLATGETLAQIQNRVLGPGVDSAPLYRSVPGYIAFSLRGGFRMGERHSFLFDFENIGDRNYRGISWGLDAPGRSFSVRYTTTF
jgi:hemoglobin/transferrin/lactoferrin receptor protein